MRLRAILFGLPAAMLATGLIAAPRHGSIEARLQRVEDELAIRRILVDYAATLDARDYAGYAALFAPDGEWTNASGSHKGQAAIRAMLESVMGRPEPGYVNRSNFHIIFNPQVDVTGDTAKATSRYIFVMRAPDGRPQPSLSGIYTDDLVRLDGVWKIRRRVANDLMPTAQEWARIIAAGNLKP